MVAVLYLYYLVFIEIFILSTTAIRYHQTISKEEMDRRLVNSLIPSPVQIDYFV